MKTITVYLEDKEYEIAKKNKGKKTWRQVVMGEAPSKKGGVSEYRFSL